MNMVTTLIKSRHSVRRFKPDPVSEIIIKDALECASRAPTARNAQAWIFGVLTDPVIKGNVANLTKHGSFIAEAPVCCAIFGEKTHPYYVEDCCAATQNLILALNSYGISSCWVAGHNIPTADKIRTLLGVPENYSLVSLVASGQPDEVIVAPKKALKRLIFYDTWVREE